MSDLKPSLVWEGPSFPLQNDPQMSDLPMVSSFQTILRAQHGPPRKTRMFCIFVYNMLTYVACFLAFMLEFVTVCAFSGGHKYGLGTGPSITSKASSWLSTCSGCEGAGHCSCEEPRLQRILAVVVVVSEPSGISLLQGRPRKHEGTKHATCVQSHPFQVGVLKWCAKPSTPEGSEPNSERWIKPHVRSQAEPCLGRAVISVAK